MNEKAKELSLACIKLAAYMRRHELRRRFESFAFELLEKSALSDRDGMLRIIATLEQFSDFAKIIYEIEPVNAEILKNELSNFRITIEKETDLLREVQKKQVMPDIGSIFSKQSKLFEVSQEAINDKKRAIKKEKIGSQIAAKNAKDNGNENEDSKSIKTEQYSFKVEKENITANTMMQLPQSELPQKIKQEPVSVDEAAIRQSEIAEKIKQSDQAPIYLKDIIAAFPNFSERTLRYDLQRLCIQGIIERIGTGGRNSYYRARVI